MMDATSTLTCSGRRQAVEPVIGHQKADHRMDRCWLKGYDGDAIHAVLCAAGFNLRWLLRALARVGLLALLALINMVVAVAELLRPYSIAVDDLISNRAAE